MDTNADTIGVPTLATVCGISRTLGARLAKRGVIRAWRLPGGRTRWRVPLAEARRFAATCGVDLTQALARRSP